MAGADQHQRIEICVPSAQPPVQAGRDPTSGVTGVQRAERFATAQRLSGPHGGAYRLIGGAQTTVVVHGNYPATCQRTRVDDNAGTGGQDGLTIRADQIGAPVTWTVRLRRWLERPAEGRDRLQRPAERPSRRRADHWLAGECRRGRWHVPTGTTGTTGTEDGQRHASH